MNQHYKTIWISDIHLGTPGCRAEELKNFLSTLTCDKLIICGDFIDAWALEKRWFWPTEHTDVIHTLIHKAESEKCEVVYVSGNHDEFLRDLLPNQQMILGNVRIVNELEYLTIKGKRLWVVHGDQYDILMKHYRAVEFFGDFVYETLLWINQKYDQVRRKYNLRRFSLITFLKKRIRLVKKYMKIFEETLTKEASVRGMDGVICGHIHKATSKKVNNIDFWNCGDWVDSCTAIVETHNGEMCIVHWVYNSKDEKYELFKITGE